MAGVKITQGTHPAGQPPTKPVGHPESRPAGNGPDKSNAPPRGQQPGADARKQSEVHSPQAKTERLGNLERQRQHVLERLEKAGDRHTPAGEKKQAGSDRVEHKSHGQQTDGPENGKAKSQQGDAPRPEGQQAREAAKEAKQQAHETAQGAKQEAQGAKQEAREAAQGVRQEAREAAGEARDAARQGSQGRGPDSQPETGRGRGGDGGHGGGNGDAEKLAERGRGNFPVGQGRGHQEGSGRPGNGNGVGRDQGENYNQGENGPGLRPRGEVASSLAHLRNEARGLLKDLQQDVKQTLNTVSQGLGRDVAGEVGRGRVEQLEKFVAHLLRHPGQGGETREHPSGRNPWEGRGPESAHRQTTKQAADAVQLLKHFAHLEKKGGEFVRRAEAAALRFISDGLRETASTSGGQNRSARLNFDRVGELLRDLRGGAFLPPPEPGGISYASARARLVVEMAELLHTLEAIERATAGGVGALAGDDPELTGLRLSGAGFAALGLGDVPEELLGLLPMLPGRAGRVEMLRFMAALTGPLVDAQGRVLLSKDGVPLKPGELLWLGAAGGLLSGRHDWEGSRVHLSSLLVNGFDALYTLIGFDGRALASPHYAAVQVQVNASDLEWVFGQPPLTEGWARAHIERMKDAAVPDFNMLGEALEEALLDGRFHTVLLRGSVAEGEPVEDSFSLARLPAEGPSFSWA